MEKLQRVVVGVDFSAPSIAAAKWAAWNLARANNAELVLVHSVFVPEPPDFLRGRFPPVERLVDAARVGAEARLRALSQSLGTERIRTQVRVGEPADQVAQAARELGADMIVAGKHGVRLGVWSRLGSTGERLVRRSSVPVLLASGLPDAQPRRLLVALDDGPAHIWILRWARLFADRFDARVTALQVVSSMVQSHICAGYAPVAPWVDFEEQEIRDEFLHETDRWIDKLVGAGLDRERACSEVAFGEPGQEILTAAERLGADLIVVGNRGAGRALRALLGSVASEVLHGAACPVMVVVEPEDEISGR